MVSRNIDSLNLSLWDAVQKGDAGTVGFCLANTDVDPNYVNPNTRENKDQWTPMHVCAARDDAAVCELLLNKGANIEARDRVGCTPLHLCARDNNQVASALIQAGADVNCRGPAGWTPLHMSAAYNHNDVTHLLLTSGADTNVTNDGGRTALHECCEWSRCDAAQLILSAPSFTQLHAKDDKGDTALDIARRQLKKDPPKVFAKGPKKQDDRTRQELIALLEKAVEAAGTS